jgi:hypothetical protein
VIGLEGQITALRYMQQAERLGRNAQGIVADAPTQRVAAIEAAMQAGYPTYVTQEVAGIAEQYSFSGEGPLIRVWPRGAVAVDPPAHRLEVALADGQLTLVGYELIWLEEAGGSALRVILHWRPERPLDQQYKVSLRLVAANGSPVTGPTGAAVMADRFPLRQVAPTTAWLPGETIRDVHDLALPPDARTTAAQLQLVLYDAITIAEAGSVQLPLP